jgi:hypothetical protein
MSPRKAPPPSPESIAAREANRRKDEPFVAPERAAEGHGEAFEYKVVGRHTVHDVKPGDSIHLTHSAARALVLSGNLELVEVPADAIEETPVDEPVVADETGHSPELTESE